VERRSGEVLGGGEAGLQVECLGVVGAELQGGVELCRGGGGVAAMEERDGKVVVVVGIVGVGGDRLLEEGDGVLALAAEGDGLVVDDLGKWKAGGDELECLLRVGLLGGVEAGEAEVEAGFEGEAVVGGDFGEGRGRGVVLAGGVLRLSEGEERGGVVARFGDGELKALQALDLAWGVGAADVVLKGGEFDSRRSGEEGLLRDGELRVDLAGDLPGDGVFDVEEAVEIAGVFERQREAQRLYGEDAGLYGNAAGVYGVVAEDDVVGVERLRDAEGGGAGGLEVDGKAEVVEGELAVVAGDGEEAGGAEALVEGVGEGVADPVQGRVAGTVLEGQDEDEAAGGGAVECGLGSCCRDDEG